jgi:hypothetical protein
MVHYGYGKSRYLLQPSQMANAMKFSNFAVLVNGFAMAFLKISIGLSLLRLQLGKGMVWIVWGAMILSVCVNLLVVVTTLFGCRPLAATWDRSLMPIASCLPRTVNVSHSYIQTSKPHSPQYVTVKTNFLQRAISSRTCSTASVHSTTSRKSKYQSTTNGPCAVCS